MKIRFQADADLNQSIVKAVLRIEPSIDFQTAHSARLESLSDIEVLIQAAKEDRVLVSHDRKTMPKHFGEFIKRSISPGVIIFPQNTSISDAAEEILLIWSITEQEEWVNRIYCA